MPPVVQVKLLRVLQEREFARLGGHQTIKVDVREIAATNRDLTREVAEGVFRQDLYYRLNVFPLHLPPLRERPEDIALLVHFFVCRYANKIGRTISRIRKETIVRLASYSWPGNALELEHVIERAVILSSCEELEIGPEILPVAPIHRSQNDDSKGEASRQKGGDSDNGLGSLSALERSHTVVALKSANWRMDGPNGAARILNLNPSTS